jgi:predicted dehydrogenase
MKPQDVQYLPTSFKPGGPGIGVIGAGNISGAHLAGYRDAGYNVVAICDIDISRAEARRDEFFPQAAVTADHLELLARPDVEVADITTHPEVRPQLVRAALKAGKHVLSQKPFVLDLDEGQSLIEEADRQGKVLAVNQNLRWSPHYAYLLAAARGGLLGQISSADFAFYWAHDLLVKDHPVFPTMEDLIIYDNAIHWFDLVAQLFASHGPATSVYATVGRTPDQAIPAPTLAQVIITYPDATVTFLWRGAAHRAESGAYRVEGTEGSLTYAAPDGLGLRAPSSVVFHGDGDPQALDLERADAMGGTMAELLSAIEEGRRPSHDARTVMAGLALCFAAMQSARTGQAVDPGTVKIKPA